MKQYHPVYYKSIFWVHVFCFKDHISLQEEIIYLSDIRSICGVPHEAGFGKRVTMTGELYCCFLAISASSSACNSCTVCSGAEMKNRQYSRKSNCNFVNFGENLHCYYQATDTNVPPALYNQCSFAILCSLKHFRMKRLIVSAIFSWFWRYYW